MNASGPRRKILIVDDDPKITAFIATQLKAQGYVVESAMDGSQGIEKATELLPHLIILDLNMPVMGGLEALGRLREWFEGPIIILSATDEENKKVEALDLGADDYLTKPFGIQELLAPHLAGQMCYPCIEPTMYPCSEPGPEP